MVEGEEIKTIAEQYKELHPDAIESKDLAFDIAEATKEAEEQMRRYAEKAIDAAKSDNSVLANQLLDTMQRFKDHAARLSDLITSVHDRTKRIINGEDKQEEVA